MNFFGKSYNEIETELNETKNKVLLLEEKIDGLIKRDLDMTTLLHDFNDKIKALEEKCKKTTTSLISFTYNSLIKFIDINCSDISIVYGDSFSKSGQDWQRFNLNFDNVQINSDMYTEIHPRRHGEWFETYTFESIYKLINELKNIRVINYQFRFPIHGENNKTPNYLMYFRGHFDILKKITTINNGVKIILSFTSHFPFEWLTYIFKDLLTDNILEIEIFYSYSVDNDDYIKDIINGLDREVSKKITFTNLNKR
jgi:hypothetical protein